MPSPRALRLCRLRRLQLDVVLLGAVAAKAPWQTAWALVAGGRGQQLVSRVAWNLVLAQSRWAQALELIGRALLERQEHRKHGSGVIQQR